MAIEPDIVVGLTLNQLEAMKGLRNLQRNKGGLIIGSITKEDTLHLSFMPTEFAKRLIAYHKADLEEKTEVPK
jgi:hypothetical protein